MGIDVVHSCVSLFCYNALFSKLGFRFRHAHFFIYVQIKTGIEFALVCEHKDIAFLIWDIFC